MPKNTWLKGSCIVLLLGCNPAEQPQFEKMAAARTGIFFSNDVEETDEKNMLTFEYIYNGAGVGTADFNGNGLQDLFFVANENGHHLYVNQGNFSFKNITEQAGISYSPEKWYSGVSIVDINADGLPDIYLSVSGKSEPEFRINELYIHQGVQENGIPFFTEMAKEYGLDHPSYTTHTAFFDYDNDGVLDAYLVTSGANNENNYVNVFLPRGETDTDMDYLLKGIWDEEAGHPKFHDVSREAGILKGGVGLGINITDINQDGYPDIYVTNDYISEDLFWINNKNGTFTNLADSLFGHTSFSAMGTDVADITNNGLPDIITLDMLPEVNVRAKMMANPNNYRNYVNKAFDNIQPQYTRNTLQLNRGMAPDARLPVFSEIALVAGVHATDWSWAPLFADFTNSSYKDLFVTNGIPRDVTDLDFWDEYGRVRNIMPMAMALSKIPAIKTHDYIFENIGKAKFKDRTKAWGFDTPTYSTGAVYVDLNNNGWLDLVVNQTNGAALVYRNNGSQTGNWLKVKLSGQGKNLSSLGASVTLFFGDGNIHRHENTPYRGYLSSVDPVLHFGLGEFAKADSVIVQWNEWGISYYKTLYNVEANQTINIETRDGVMGKPAGDKANTRQQIYLTEITKQFDFGARPEVQSFNVFALQPLLPYNISETGPAAAIGDITGNGYDDLFIGPAAGRNAYFLIHHEDGHFTKKPVVELVPDFPENMHFHDALIFDANGDGYNDLYLAAGTGFIQNSAHDAQDRFYVNDGAGNFIYQPAALPALATNNYVVISGDFNMDGKPDLFIGTRPEIGKYPLAETHYLLENRSDEEIKFVDVTQKAAPDLLTAGMINDAKWFDINGNGRPDLITAGEWEPIRIFINEGGILSEKTGEFGFENTNGWWNTLEIADLNNDGLPDIIAGNLGLNSLFKADNDKPASIYYGDLTENGFFEAIPSVYRKDAEGNYQEYPFHSRADLIRLMPSVARLYASNREFGQETMQDFLAKFPGKFKKKNANTFETSVFYNRSGTFFEKGRLPAEIQYAPVYDINVVKGTDGADFAQVTVAGNYKSADLFTGSYNAGVNGMLEFQEGEAAHFVNYGTSGIPLKPYFRKTFVAESMYGAVWFFMDDLGNTRVFHPNIEYLTQKYEE